MQVMIVACGVGLGIGTAYRYKTGFSYWTGPEKTDLKKLGGPDVGPIRKLTDYFMKHSHVLALAGGRK